MTDISLDFINLKGNPKLVAMIMVAFRTMLQDDDLAAIHDFRNMTDDDILKIASLINSD